MMTFPILMESHNPFTFQTINQYISLTIINHHKMAVPVTTNQKNIQHGPVIFMSFMVTFAWTKAPS